MLLTLAGSARAQGWVPFKINTGGNDLNTVYFLDSKRGWVGGDGGYLSHTEDGGQIVDAPERRHERRHQRHLLS